MPRRDTTALTSAQVHYRQTYLRSDHWIETAAAARQRAGHRCQDCGAAGPLDVHHLTYERIGHELPADLKALCRACHDEAHRQASNAAPIYTSRSSRRKAHKRKAKRVARRKTHAVRGVSCPRCGAKPGKPCKSGSHATGNHAERLAEAGYGLAA